MNDEYIIINMEYTIDQLGDAIMYYLSINAETPLSMNKIYNDLFDICPDLKTHKYKELFQTTCLMMETTYKHIYKLYKNSTVYLVFSPEDKQLAIVKYQNIINNNFVDNVEENIDYCNLIKNMLDNPQVGQKFNLNEYIDGTNTPLHVLCKNNKTDTLKTVLDRYHVDVDIQNKDGLKLIDVLPQDPSSYETMKLLLSNEAKAKFFDYELKLQNLKLENTKLMTASYTSQQELTNAQTELNMKDKNLFWTKIFIILMFVVYIYRLFL
jgi:hypothetical protein